MKTLTLTLLAAGMMFGATFTGVISDDGCKGDHRAMNMGNDAQCTVACVKAHGSQYVLWDGKQAYVLSDQKTPEQYAGKKVTVTGTMDAKAGSIKVDSIKPAQ
jgi:Protein of unknown function (DUF5818)